MLIFKVNIESETQGEKLKHCCEDPVKQKEFHVFFFFRVGDGYLVIGKPLGRIIMRRLNLSTM